MFIALSVADKHHQYLVCPISYTCNENCLHNENFIDYRDTLTSARGQWLYGLLARLEKPLDRNLASLMRELYRTCSHLRATIDEDDSKFDVQIASLNVLIAITGSYFGQGEEYSTLSTGYGDDEEEDDEDEDDEDNDDDYYFTGEGEGDIEPFQGVYRIGDDIWNDPVTMAVESNPSQSRELEGSGNNYDNSSFLRKRTAENSAEEGEEVEEEGGDIL